MEDWEKYNVEDILAKGNSQTNLDVYTYNAYYRKIMEILDANFRPGDLVLDIGCGIGEVSARK